MSDKRTLHLVGQAHLDPVWIWPWRDGVSEAMTTLQSAVNFLDSEPDFKFTRASSEIYRWVQQADPRLFERIKHYVAEGRWEIVGGWVEQPDCNLPSTESFVRQSLYGKSYFQQEFGVDVKIGYNVDSFGHSVGLPQLLKRAGFTHYICMRPMVWETDLPALFWWESPDGSRVLTWKLPQNYGQEPHADADRFEQDVRQAVEVGFAPGMQHGMFFYGVGNHGGGPTRRQLDRIRQLQNDPEMPEIKFSTVAEYFAAIEADPAMADVPVIKTELNKHAPGCYSAHARIKRDARRAERQLVLAETAATASRIATPNPPLAANLQRPWEHLLFNQFHDILGGTCTPTNDPSIRDRFGAAIHPADEVATLALHRVAREVDLSGVPEGALFLWNPLPWPRLVEVGFDTFQAPNGGEPLKRLVAPDGEKDYPIQWTNAEPCFGPMGMEWKRLNAVVPLPACGYRVFTLDAAEPTRHTAPLEPCFLADEENPGIYEWDTPCGDKLLAAPISLSIWQDTGDTWGHKLDGYDECIGTPALKESTVLVEGPLMRCVRQRATWKNSEIMIHFRQWIHQPGIEISLRVNWQEHREILRLEIPTALTHAITAAASPGANVERPTNSGEQPASEWVVLTGLLGEVQTESVQLVTDGGLSYSSAEGCLRAIVTRSAYYAHHHPKSPQDPLENPLLDQGWQESRFWINAGTGNFNAINAHRYAAEVLHTAERVYDSAHPGTLPREASLISVEPANVTMTACKLAEDGAGWIVRLIETSGKDTTATLRSTLGEAREWTVEVLAASLITVRLPLNGNAPAVLTDLLENPTPPSN